MDEKHQSKDFIASPPPPASPNDDRMPLGARIFLACSILGFAGLAYFMIFYAIPGGQALALEKQRATEATIRGPEVAQEMLEEMRKLRAVMEEIAAKL